MFSSTQRSSGGGSSRTANILRYLGRESFASLDDDDYYEEDNRSTTVDPGECSSLTIDENSALASAPIQFTLREEEEGESSSLLEPEDLLLGPQEALASQRRHLQQQQQQSDDGEPMIELDTENLDIEHYMLSVFDNFDDSSTIYTGGTASTSFSSTTTSSTRTRHRGAYRNRRKHSSKKSTTAPKSWMESMEHSAFQQRLGLEWTPKKGWQRKQDKDKWDATPKGDWGKPMAMFDCVNQERIEI